MYKGWCS